MLIWALAATAATLIIMLVWGAYRRQVRKTCRQLAFLKEEETNLRLTGELPFSELNELIDGINEVLDRARSVEQQAKQGEDRLRETVTNLSHDIRTPLTSVDGYLQLLMNSEDEEERQHYISVIRGRVGNLKEMLEELFTYAKLGDRAYELTVEPTDFGKCVFDTVFSFYDDFGAKGIEPQIQFSEKRLYVEGNVEAFGRMLRNIIKNALEHGKKDIALELREDGTEAIFLCKNRVEHPENIDVSQVFTRFYKADAARTHTSTGLGLYIAKTLAERMGGTMTAAVQEDWFSVEVRMPLYEK